MTVNIPGPLRSYTGGARLVTAEGANLAELVAGLDRLYPGIRFRIIDEQGRIRQHIRFFVDTEPAGSLDTRLQAASEVHIICALSGG